MLLILKQFPQKCLPARWLCPGRAKLATPAILSWLLFLKACESQQTSPLTHGKHIRTLIPECYLLQLTASMQAEAPQKVLAVRSCSECDMALSISQTPSPSTNTHSHTQTHTHTRSLSRLRGAVRAVRSRVGNVQSHLASEAVKSFLVWELQQFAC